MCVLLIGRRVLFFNDTATTEIYTLSLHDALPISESQSKDRGQARSATRGALRSRMKAALPAVAFVVLALGIALTAMRTTLVAFAFGACVVAWRASARGRQRAWVVGAVTVVLALGALAVW